MTQIVFLYIIFMTLKSKNRIPPAVKWRDANRLLLKGWMIMQDPTIQAAETLEAVRERTPLIHNITNFVAMNFIANALLSAGASPVMAHSAEEVEEMADLADALALNIGTLTGEWIAAMIQAGRAAAQRNKPVVLDPVGAGATTFRTASARKILQKVPVRIIRGNPSEVLSLRGGDSRTKGVDAIHSVEEAAEAARILARELDLTLAVTGPVDLVTDGDRLIRIRNGHPLMARVTGAGCTATALIAAFAAVNPDPVSAAASALAFFDVAGEKASQTATAPGSFMIALLDALHTLTPDELRQGANIETEKLP